MTERFPMPMPYGWFCVGYSDELAVQEVKNIHYFERDMVLFRTASGKLGLTSPVCPHLGAHLGHGGTVQGESIRCPFHHWHYDTDGVITDIPYASRIPPKWEGKPCLKTYSVCEQNNVIWAWYHPNDAKPEYPVLELPEASNEDWTHNRRYSWEFNSCPQEIAENGVDVAHFQFVHKMEAVPLGKTEYEGHIRRSLVTGSHMVPDETGDVKEVEVSVSVVQNGAGQKWTRFSGVGDYLVQVLVTPVAREKVEVRFAYSYPKHEKGSYLDNVMEYSIATTNGQQGLEGDIPIWHNKFHLVKPVLCDGDGPIMQFRKYFSQFYVAENDIPVKQV